MTITGKVTPSYISEMDSRLKCRINTSATSPNPEAAIWRFQHITKNGFDNKPVPRQPGKAVIKHQLQGNRGHWAVLDGAYIVLEFGGFPHYTAMQMRTHRDSQTLIQTFRETNNKAKLWFQGDCEISIEDLYYIRPVGIYYDRKGHATHFTEDSRKKRLDQCQENIIQFNRMLEQRESPEIARDILFDCRRQDFTMAGTVKDLFHWLDQRSKADAQMEARVVAHLAVQECKKIIPTLIGWYLESRYTKAITSP